MYVTICVYITQEYSDVCRLWRKTYVLHLSGRTICDTSHPTMYIRKQRTVVCETHDIGFHNCDISNPLQIVHIY